ncbi:uncharacterized protein B0H18DRAFT_929208 [Fomitopsis serialis]|uniref:uncharacterized protein n=1 Tax=Fomitopsis serialis TaxID=139415 RepID=UPI002008BAB4|nr:uncharacterized protein B0H18DRAFT_929208 [Neoantrodia serialis]KAH9932374.1 hypothetical protein B0H18DRAFT_929208 [Neoantrodia serialis]
MAPTVRDLIFVLEMFFPRWMAMGQALCVLDTVRLLFPILQLHRRQRQDRRQPRLTGWLKSILASIKTAYQGPQAHIGYGGREAEAEAEEYAEAMHGDLEVLFELMGWDDEHPVNAGLYTNSYLVLCTERRSCAVCAITGHEASLRRRIEGRRVKVLTAGLRWVQAELFVGHCINCRADHYPDRVTYPNGHGERIERLEYDTKYLRISKHGIWTERDVAVMQEHMLLRFRAGWSNVADYINDLLPQGTLQVTYRQSRRLFLEHFSRRLLVAHQKAHDFTCPAHPSSQMFAEHVRRKIGEDGGVNIQALHHGCTGCTHRKRYRADLVQEGAMFHEIDAVAGIQRADLELAAVDNANAEIRPIPVGIPIRPPAQDAPAPGEPRGYVRMAVMDGKNVGHRICALEDCRKPLINFRDGRFCQDHTPMQDICGIIPCGRPVRNHSAMTCDDPVHRNWHQQWLNRFSRLSFPGVQRVIRQQRLDPNAGHAPRAGPTLRVNLPALNEIPGDRVVHTFRARSVYCLETLQWACGMPIAWGKCYKSESQPQVYAFIDRVWQTHRDLRPGFIAYDDACDLLRHIVTQNPGDSWLTTTKFIVDAWHYIGHKATDALCRMWCNPAPKDGSQPDLVLIQEDEDGARHQIRAFNTETAEQLNSWLDGFEAQLRNMTNINYDIFVHTLFMLYAERVQRRIDSSGDALDDGFWEEVDARAEQGEAAIDDRMRVDQDEAAIDDRMRVD